MSSKSRFILSLFAAGVFIASCGSPSNLGVGQTPSTTVRVKTTFVTTSTTVSTSPTPSNKLLSSGSVPPTLGLANVYSGGTGFGSAEPTEIYLGGDPTGLVTGIRWSSWGGATADGVGTGSYVGPSEIVAQARLMTAKVVAFDLGECNGTYAYQKVEWYFAGEGETFDPVHGITTCLFFGQPSNQ